MLPVRRAQILIAAIAITALYLFLPSYQTPPEESFQDTLSHYKPGPPQPPPEPVHTALKTSITSLSSSSLQSDEEQTYSGGRKQHKQIPLSEMADKPLRTKLALRFPYHIEDRFPAYIWQTWRNTPASGDFPEDWRPMEASWSETHPGFVHEVIDDASALHVLRHLYSGIPEPIAAYEALDRAVLKADFFRYLILLARGGIYSDIDTRALKSAYEWVPENVARTSYGLVVGIEADPDREDWEKWYSRRVQFCQWTIQAKPGHPVLVDIVAHITEEALKRKANGTLNKSAAAAEDDGVMDFTGPGLWTDVIFKYLNDPKYFDIAASKLGNITWKQFTGITSQKKVGDVVILPITSFSPGVGQMGAGDVSDPMAFVHHAFEGQRANTLAAARAARRTHNRFRVVET